jgi:hypothetical protein
MMRDQVRFFLPQALMTTGRSSRALAIVTTSCRAKYGLHTPLQSVLTITGAPLNNYVKWTCYPPFSQWTFYTPYTPGAVGAAGGGAAE